MFYASQKLLRFFTFLLVPFVLCIHASTIADSIITNNEELTRRKNSTDLPTFNLAPVYNYTPAINSEFHPHVTTELHPNIIISNTSDLSVKISNISLQCIQKIQETITRENCHLLKNLITKTLWEYRYMIACGTLMGSYSIVSLLLLADYYHYLQGTTLWARWKPECSFETLCTMPQKELTQELLTTINERHYNKNNPTDFAHPLTMFIVTIDGEIKTCKRYIATAQIIKRLRLMYIFPTNDNKIDEVNKLLQRALFIKHIFLSWLSDYNITSNQKVKL